jgi:hypothetical protein
MEGAAGVNERLAENAAVAHVQWAQLVTRDGRINDAVGEVELALLLGRMLRELAVLNVKIDTLEKLLARQQQ